MPPNLDVYWLAAIVTILGFIVSKVMPIFRGHNTRLMVFATFISLVMSVMLMKSSGIELITALEIWSIAAIPLLIYGLWDKIIAGFVLLAIIGVIIIASYL